MLFVAAVLPNTDFTGVLDRYEKKLASFHTPGLMSFEYTVDQAGFRGLAQTHRIYRSGTTVRDETMSSGGLRHKPRIRIMRNRINAYALETIAPRRAAYLFLPIGVERNGNHLDYRFRTVPVTRSAIFSVREIVIDGARSLPSSLAFTAEGPMANGSGTLRYGLIEHAWVVLEASAAGTAIKQSLREHLAFTNYHFPTSLPSSTFGAAGAAP